MLVNQDDLFQYAQHILRTQPDDTPKELTDAIVSEFHVLPRYFPEGDNAPKVVEGRILTGGLDHDFETLRRSPAYVEQMILDARDLIATAEYVQTFVKNDPESDVNRLAAVLHSTTDASLEDCREQAAELLALGVTLTPIGK